MYAHTDGLQRSELVWVVFALVDLRVRHGTQVTKNARAPPVSCCNSRSMTSPVSASSIAICSKRERKSHPNNRDARLLSSERWSFCHCQIYSVARSRRRYPIKIASSRTIHWARQKSTSRDIIQLCRNLWLGPSGRGAATKGPQGLRSAFT